MATGNPEVAGTAIAGFVNEQSVLAHVGCESRPHVAGRPNVREKGF